MSGRFPEFLGIGAQKAGTTWLYENLRHHPGLFLPEEKELHFFDWNLKRGLQHYRSHFAGAGDRLCGEITPAYGFLPTDLIRSIHRENPNLRLILLLRNPIQRAWSGAVMQLASFRDCDPATIPEQEYREYLRSAHSIDRTRYTPMIDRWSSLFPMEQLFVGFFEDLQRRPWPLLQDVFRHIGVSSEVSPSAFPYRQVVVPALSKKLRSKGFSVLSRRPVGQNLVPVFARELLEDLHREEILALKRRFGSRCECW